MWSPTGCSRFPAFPSAMPQSRGERAGSPPGVGGHPTGEATASRVDRSPARPSAPSAISAVHTTVIAVRAAAEAHGRRPTASRPRVPAPNAHRRQAGAAGPGAVDDDAAAIACRWRSAKAGRRVGPGPGWPGSGRPRSSAQGVGMSGWVRVRWGTVRSRAGRRRTRARTSGHAAASPSPRPGTRPARRSPAGRRRTTAPSSSVPRRPVSPIHPEVRCRVTLRQRAGCGFRLDIVGPGGGCMDASAAIRVAASSGATTSGRSCRITARQRDTSRGPRPRYMSGLRTARQTGQHPPTIGNIVERRPVDQSSGPSRLRTPAILRKGGGAAALRGRGATARPGQGT